MDGCTITDYIKHIKMFQSQVDNDDMNILTIIYICYSFVIAVLRIHNTYL